jgi:vitamin B12 transporter
MSVLRGRFSAPSVLRALIAFAAFAILTTFARAVVVRGIVTDAFGRPVSAARVQLVQGPNVIAFTLTAPDGSYEIRSTEPGRFTLLTSAPAYFPAIGEDFYGGRTDVLTRDSVLEASSYHEVVTVTATGMPTPVEQTSSAVTLIPERDLAARVGVVDELRQSAGVAVVQTGQAGGVTSLFVRGGNSDANKVLIDGIPAEDVGGRFDFGTVSSTGIGASGKSEAAIELYRGPDSVIYGSDASASVVSFTTPRGIATKPVLNYSGDAGNLHTYRNEVAVSGTRQKLDYLAMFSRFNTSNALPMDEYHSVTAAANLGYAITANTRARFTLRNADSATGLPGAHDFFGISAAGKESDQDIYSGLTLENTTAGNWHNLARYGIARKREQAKQFASVGLPMTYNFGTVPCNAPTANCFTEYFGDVLTIRGANGYKATGQASFFSPNDNSVSNRDELYYQSDYVFPHRIAALFGFHYENERGSFVGPGTIQTVQRTNFEYTLEFHGDIGSRIFYSLGGAFEKNHLYGVAGTPRLGLAYVPVRPGSKLFHGTRLRINVATGVQEPSLAIQFSSLYSQLLLSGNSAAIAAYRIAPIGPSRSRTYDAGVEQNVLGQKLILKVGYFHNQFSHQFDYVDTGTLKADFGIQTGLSSIYGAEINSLAFRAQGIETEIQYQPSQRLFLRGGYTYLDAVVEQSFSTDAAYNGTSAENPNLPGIPIGSTYPLVGARPFRRPPNTGFFAVQYTGGKFGAALEGALASRSDDSTYLSGSDPNFGNTLLLPNRDLDFGYAKLDATVSYAVMPRLTAFAQLDNLLNQQHIGPIGYPGLPLTVRAGFKVRLGGD